MPVSQRCNVPCSCEDVQRVRVFSGQSSDCGGTDWSTAAENKYRRLGHFKLSEGILAKDEINECSAGKPSYLRNGKMIHPTPRCITKYIYTGEVWFNLFSTALKRSSQVHRNLPLVQQCTHLFDLCPTRILCETIHVSHTLVSSITSSNPCSSRLVFFAVSWLRWGGSENIILLFSYSSVRERDERNLQANNIEWWLIVTPWKDSRKVNYCQRVMKSFSVLYLLILALDSELSLICSFWFWRGGNSCWNHHVRISFMLTLSLLSWKLQPTFCA